MTHIVEFPGSEGVSGTATGAAGAAGNLACFKHLDLKQPLAGSRMDTLQNSIKTYSDQKVRNKTQNTCRTECEPEPETKRESTRTRDRDTTKVKAKVRAREGQRERIRARDRGSERHMEVPFLQGAQRVHGYSTGAR